jgi:hypothetical protein
MRIEKAYIEVFKVSKKSFTALVGYHKNEKGEIPLLMLTSSKKVLKNPQEGDEYVADICLRKDNNFNIWLVIEDIIQKL